MRWIRFSVLICLATIIQASFLSNYIIRPDLLTIVLVFFAVYGNVTDAIITSFTIGFAADLIGPTMGSFMISFGILGTSLSHLNRVIAIRRTPHQVLSIFVITILAGIMANMLNSFKGISTTEFSVILKNSLFSCIVGPFLFKPFAWWMQIKTPRRQRRF